MKKKNNEQKIDNEQKINNEQKIDNEQKINNDVQKEQIKNKMIDDSIYFGKLIQTMVNTVLSGYLNLEFEKVLDDFIIFTKKRYVGWLYDKSSD